MGLSSRAVEAQIERAGFGRAQVVVALLGYGLWFADGCELQLLAVLVHPMAKEFGLSIPTTAALAASVNVGFMVGAAAAGFLADRFGRRPPLLCGYACLPAFAVAMCFCRNAEQMFAMRLLTGLLMGTVSASLSLVSELTPRKWRMGTMVLRSMLCYLGVTVGSLILVADDASLMNNNWRWCMWASAVPTSLLGVAAYCWLPESPLFDAKSGNMSGVAQTLDWLFRANGERDRPAPEELRGLVNRRFF